MTYLVTGGSGFLGSYLVRYLALTAGVDGVVVLDKFIDRERLGDELANVTVVEGDVTDLDTVRGVIDKYSVDRIAHLAFGVGQPAIESILPYVQVQTLGTAAVFEAARLGGVERVVYGSSVGTYGHHDVTPLTEDLPPLAKDPYGASKVWGEALGNFYSTKHGLQVITVRFGSTFGMGRAWRGSYNSGLLKRGIDRHYMARVEDAVQGRAITLPRGDVSVNWTYAADAGKATYLALSAAAPSYDLYNVVSEVRPIADFTNRLIELLPDADIRVDENEEPWPPHPRMSNARLVEDLGFTPDFPVEIGVEDYVRRAKRYYGVE